MLKKQRNLIILLVIAVGLFAMYFIFDQQEKQRLAEETTPTTSELKTLEALVDFQRTDLKSITIENDDSKLVFETELMPIEESEATETEAQDVNDEEQTTEAEEEGGEPSESETQAPPQPRVWVLAEPKIERGPTEKSIQDVAGSLERLFVSRELTEIAELSDYGLDEPQAEVSYETDDGDEVTVLLGDELQGGNKYYAKRADQDRVVIIGTAAKAMLSRPTDLIPLEVMPGTGGQFRTFEVKREQDDFTFAGELEIIPAVSGEQRELAEEILDATDTKLNEQERGLLQWTLTEPKVWPADDTKLITFMNEIGAIKATEWLEIAPDEETMKDYGLDEPRMAFSYMVTDDQKGELLLGESRGDGQHIAYSSVQDAIFTYASGSLPSQGMRATDFINTFSYIENINQVGEIKLTVDGEEYEFEVFNPTQEEKEEDDSLEPKYLLNGEDANIMNEKDRGYFNSFYQSVISVMIRGFDLEADPELDSSTSIVFVNRHTDDEESVELVERDERTFYIFRNGEYTGFYTSKDEVYGSGPQDDEAILPSLTLLEEAMAGAENGVFVRPTEADPEATEAP